MVGGCNDVDEEYMKIKCQRYEVRHSSGRKKTMGIPVRERRSQHCMKSYLEGNTSSVDTLASAPTVVLTAVPLGSGSIKRTN